MVCVDEWMFQISRFLMDLIKLMMNILLCRLIMLIRTCHRILSESYLCSWWSVNLTWTIIYLNLINSTIKTLIFGCPVLSWGRLGNWLNISFLRLEEVILDINWFGCHWRNLVKRIRFGLFDFFMFIPCILIRPLSFWVAHSQSCFKFIWFPSNKCVLFFLLFLHSFFKFIFIIAILFILRNHRWDLSNFKGAQILFSLFLSICLISCSL